MNNPRRSLVRVATAAIILETRKPKSDGTFPITLRVTYNRKSKYYSLQRYTTIEKWNKRTIALNAWVVKEQEKADGIITELPEFSFEAFYRKRRDASDDDEKDVFAAYKNVIKEFRANGQEGTAVNYECAKSSLNKFVQEKGIRNLKFANITPGFLTRYENWMLTEKEKKSTTTTVSIYLRTLRTLFNKAITTGVINRDLYPFGKGKYEVTAGRNIKKALSLADIAKIYNYSGIEGSREQWGRDMWVFSYLCNGVNIADIARLKYKNIDFDALTITFSREKTKRTNRRNQKPIIVIITPEIGRILERYGVRPNTSESFVFDFLVGYDTPAKQLNRVKDITKQINKYIGRIAKKEGINKKVTTYAARHSFATVLKHNNFSIEMIGEALGHSDSSTTRSYLDSFEIDSKRKMAAVLTDFKQEVENEK